MCYSMLANKYLNQQARDFSSYYSAAMWLILAEPRGKVLLEFSLNTHPLPGVLPGVRYEIRHFLLAPNKLDFAVWTWPKRGPGPW